MMAVGKERQERVGQILEARLPRQHLGGDPAHLRGGRIERPAGVDQRAVLLDDLPVLEPRQTDLADLVAHGGVETRGLEVDDREGSRQERVGQLTEQIEGHPESFGGGGLDTTPLS